MLSEWWFSVIDVVSVLTDSVNPRDYWYKMKIREKDNSDVELSTICRQLKLYPSQNKTGIGCLSKSLWSHIRICFRRDLNSGFHFGTGISAPDGKLRATDCANTESLFRIIKSIPSAKAEPFKRWLVKVGYERIQEIEDPEWPPNAPLPCIRLF